MEGWVDGLMRSKRLVFTSDRVVVEVIHVITSVEQF